MGVVLSVHPNLSVSHCFLAIVKNIAMECYASVSVLFSTQTHPIGSRSRIVERYMSMVFISVTLRVGEGER